MDLNETTSSPYPDNEGSGGSLIDDVFPHIMGVLAVLEYLLMILMILGNIFILLSYFCGRTSINNSVLQLTSSGRLVLNLATADLLVGLGLSYFSIFKFWPSMAALLARYKVPCVLRFSICFCTMFGSHCALLVIGVDRYTAIVHTLHYKKLMTTKTSWVLIGLGWTVPVVGSSALFFVNQWRPNVSHCDEHHIVPQFLLTFALPSNVIVLVAVCVAHWRVHKEVKAYSTRSNDPRFVASASSSARTRSCHKSAQVLLCVTTTFIICWTPLDVMLVMFVALGPSPWLLVVFETTFLLAMVSFLLNPFVYAWKTEVIRRPLVASLTALRVLQPHAAASTPPARGTTTRPLTVGIFSVTRDNMSVHSSSSGSGLANTTTSSA